MEIDLFHYKIDLFFHLIKADFLEISERRSWEGFSAWAKPPFFSTGLPNAAVAGLYVAGDGRISLWALPAEW